MVTKWGVPKLQEKGKHLLLREKRCLHLQDDKKKRSAKRNAERTFYLLETKNLTFNGVFFFCLMECRKIQSKVGSCGRTLRKEIIIYERKLTFVSAGMAMNMIFTVAEKIV